MLQSWFQVGRILLLSFFFFNQSGPLLKFVISYIFFELLSCSIGHYSCYFWRHTNANKYQMVFYSLFTSINKSGSWKSLAVALILIFVLLYFSHLKLSTWKWKASSRDLAWITFDMASLKTTSTGFLIATISDTWLPVISPLSRAQLGRL